MCLSGPKSPGSSRALSRTLAHSDSGQPAPKRFEPQAEQNVFALPSSGWKVCTCSSPATILIAVVRARPLAVPTPPESFLQLAQWQNEPVSKGSETSKTKAPKRQRPVTGRRSPRGRRDPQPHDVVELRRRDLQ